jgi:hypothetical protein
MVDKSLVIAVVQAVQGETADMEVKAGVEALLVPEVPLEQLVPMAVLAVLVITNIRISIFIIREYRHA